MKRARLILTLICVLIIEFSALSQQAGNYTYEFLNVTNSARVGSLGGNQVGLADNDINLVFNNPANLNSALNKQITISYVPYVSGINAAFAAYAHHVDKLGSFALGIHTVNYGSFDRADEYGNRQGSFSAAEYAIHLNYAKMLSPKMQAGIAIKPIISNFEQYNSFGLAADIGVIYKSEDQLFSAGITLKNIGSQITTYNNTYEPIPRDLQIGIAKKLAHAPFRLSLTAQDLLDWKMKYTVYDGNGEEVGEIGNNDSGIDQLMRHMIVGLEFLPAKNFYVNAGYNHRRRKELGIKDKMSTAGFSWGFGFRLYKFHFSYGSARYHLAGSSNHFSITTSLDAF